MTGTTFNLTISSDGELLPQLKVIRKVVERGCHRDSHSVDIFGVGEHHREDFAVSTPEIVLAAIRFEGDPFGPRSHPKSTSRYTRNQNV